MSWSTAFYRSSTVIKRGHGLILCQGTAVDATLKTKKGSQHYFGMKVHIGVDAESGMVHGQVGTAASVADVTQVDRLLYGEESYVFGDAGYIDVDKRPRY